MKKQFRVSRLAGALAVILATSSPAFAQQTSAALGGVVTTEEGQPISGAEVIIVHTPSGTTSRAQTGPDGRYNARGLRVGGPYTVTVTREGFQGEAQENVYLLLGELSSVDVDLASSAPELEAIQVTAAAQSEIFSPDRIGAGTAITEETIESLPSIRRDLQDYVRLDPRISQTDKERSEISALGQNSRFNSITIDAVSTNDTFGLESNNLPTIRQPVSLDAIESVQVNVTNYDVTQRGYTGANINAITKSGTNDFDGSVYGTYRDGDWVRETDDRGVVFNGFEEEYTYGGTFGGPIIEDTLFFFVNYDKTTIKAPGPDIGSSPFGDEITQADVDEVIAIAQGYGLQPGNITGVGGADTEVESFLARFDWNINDFHRAAMRLSRTEQSEAIIGGFGSNFFSLSSYWYTQGKEFDNYVVELFSDWSDSFSTEARVSYRDYFSTPNVVARQPQVQIDFGNQNFRFGTEQFRHANVLETQTVNAYFAGNLFMGDHDIKFGADYETNDIYNLFLESSLGNYRFSSVEDFAAGDFRHYLYRTATSGNLNDAAAELTLDNLGLFVQDTWSVNYNLTLQYGFRYDMPMVDDPPVFNQAFFEEFGLRNDATIDGNNLFQPRFGFNYTFDSELQSQIRGGIGLFQGSAASVWLANPYTNNGTTITVFGCGTGGFANCPADAPLFEPDPDQQPEYFVGSQPRADVDLISPDLEQPSIWKANLAFEHELPFWGAVASVEAIITDVNTGIYYQHLNLGNIQGEGPDGRDLYWGSTNPSSYNAGQNRFNGGSRTGAAGGFNEVLLARETSKGHGENLTLAITKPQLADSPWYWQVAYSYTDATEVNPLTSSRAISSWRSASVFDVNEDVAGRSPYVSKDRFTAVLAWGHNFFGDNETKFSVFYEGRRGKPYSWVFNNDANGDGQAGNDLFYVPAGPDDVIFTDPSEAAEFWQIVQDNGLAQYAGNPLTRNSHFSPWVNTFDLRFAQELPGFFGDNKAEIWLDVLNVGNLINKDWGLTDEIFFQSDGAQARSFVNFAGIDPATGRYVYDLVNLEDFGRRDRSAESRWALQVGFRYEF